MKFLILGEYSSYIITAEDIEQAILDCYDNNVGYSFIRGVMVIPDDGEQDG